MTRLLLTGIAVELLSLGFRPLIPWLPTKRAARPIRNGRTGTWPRSWGTEPALPSPISERNQTMLIWLRELNPLAKL